ncbi:MAG: electron transport complex subunit RsxC, partial [Gammaproteobacteria bacterium]
PDVSKRTYQSGFICHNVATAKAVYDAVAHGKALIERLVTFSGDALAHPGVYRCKVGTTLADIGTTVGLPTDCPEVIFGGTMMGFPAQVQQPLPQVIKRETTSVLAFQHPPEHHAKPAQNCIRCGDCAEVCPMDLLPQQLQFYGRSGDHNSAEANRLFDCIECGLCTYVCPSDIALVNIFQHSKGEILNARRKKAEAEHARQRFETRNARLAAAKAERAAKAAARYAKLQSKSTATPLVDKSPADKHDLIAAALTRTQAKQAERQAQNHSSTTAENSTAGQKTAESVDGQDLIAAALARAQAKKAERQAQTANQPADSANHHNNIKT